MKDLTLTVPHLQGTDGYFTTSLNVSVTREETRTMIGVAEALKARGVSINKHTDALRWILQELKRLNDLPEPSAAEPQLTPAEETKGVEPLPTGDHA